jgi:hypothetical protein
MKPNSSFPFSPATSATSERSAIPARFSRRLARPSIGATVSALNRSLRIDDLWDSSLLDRLQSPVTRRRY